MIFLITDENRFLGLGFFFASLELNQEKIPPLKTSFISYKLIMQQKQNQRPVTCEKPLGVGFLFLLVSLKKTE